MEHMTTTKRQLGLRQIVALLLLAVTLILMFSPWIHLEATYMGAKYDLSDLLREYDGDMSELADDMLFGYGVFDEYNVVKKIAAKLDSIVACIRDSKFSPFELARVTAASSSIAGSIENALDERVDTLSTAHSYLALAAILLWAFFVAIILLIIFDMYRNWNGDTSIGAPTIITICVYFVVLAVTLIVCNTKLSIALGLNDKSFAHFDATPFICMICAIGSLVLPKYMPENLDSAHVQLADLSGISLDMGWTCDCGKRNNASAAFCADCGKKRVDFSRCENCGAPLAKGSSFCSKCGTPVNRKVFEPICPSCGKALKSGTKFCIYCGTPINADTAPEPAAERRTSPADTRHCAPAPETYPEERTGGFHTTSFMKPPMTEAPQGSGRLKIKKGGDVEYK